MSEPFVASSMEARRYHAKYSLSLFITNTASCLVIYLPVPAVLDKNSSYNFVCTHALRLRGITIGGHFHANFKVQTVTFKDNDNLKSRAATCVKFEINIKRY